MSVSYFAINVRDASQLGPLLEGGDTSVTPIDAASIRATLVAKTMVTPRPDSDTLWWEGEGCHIAVDISSRAVEVTHGGRGDSLLIEFVGEVLWTLKKAGLHVWDPQQGSWFYRD